VLRVGLPQGLLYYYYGDVWKGFLQELGVDVVISGATTRETLDCGNTLVEVCLPAKIYYGHACELRDKVDYLFVPRIVSVSRGEYSCPQIIGMPDMLRSVMHPAPPIIDVTVNMRRGGHQLYRAVTDVGRVCGKNATASLLAWCRAWRSRTRVRTKELGYSEGIRVALIGHRYILFDSQAGMNVIAKLENLGVEVLTPEMVAPREAGIAAGRVSKKVFWSNGYHLAGAAMYFMYSSRPLDGVIFLTCFACGPDAFIGEVIRHRAQMLNIPCMVLSLDEHTAENGLITRLEAFIDMLLRKEKNDCPETARKDFDRYCGGILSRE
jgi:predicted nucleotide-binding protein (sugar kinase/HSP70/actin superfamily)